MHIILTLHPSTVYHFFLPRNQTAGSYKEPNSLLHSVLEFILLRKEDSYLIVSFKGFHEYLKCSSFVFNYWKNKLVSH